MIGTFKDTRLKPATLALIEYANGITDVYRVRLHADAAPALLHPSGLDMTRDVQERLAMFARQDIEVQRLPLSLDQTAGLPSNFAEETDSRHAAYLRQFGATDCWELGALAPNVISNLVRDELDNLIDSDTWASAIAVENDNRSILTAAAGNWSLVKSVLRPAS